ncbi:MAG: hypothetical protein PHV28_09440 [Kiritimatiellae bacterium]|nr:hypothetical protein [Kiritimatiellia bacterium]
MRVKPVLKRATALALGASLCAVVKAGPPPPLTVNGSIVSRPELMMAHAGYQTRPDTNLGLMVASGKLVLDNLTLNYQAAHQAGSLEISHQKGAPLDFGCNFGRYSACGGWDKWQFLAIVVSGRPSCLDLTRSRILGDLLLLERTESRAMAELLWPFRAGQDDCAALKLLKLKEYPGWVFARLSGEGELPPIQEIQLRYFIGPSSAPAPLREGWISTQSGDYNVGTWQEINLLHKRRPPVALKTNDCGMVMHARHDPVYADYCGMLVYLPEETAGRYDSRGAQLQPGPGVRSIRFALGYSQGLHYSQVVSRFLTGECREIQALLRSMKWTPRNDFHDTDRMILELDRLSAQGKAGPVFASSDYPQVRSRYAALRANHNVREILRLAPALERLHRDVLDAAMRELLKSGG